mmetsp:Transcript_33984/g.44870  ORF Transcript_33984/g.44870 Transcript_33984/m.44870 type:complete len:193 (-) Transcript_33984:201-779(-)|eukprot:CAMPEP_0117746522 /NCGR_PEP_ID=MMETSP0947-20121206/7992_1 /TAXON_ID=44440 /ORGANISM="Chattonella subsalsa, Strain CCMP2191" /LENGTH=192 /DNA_ID=CAMNT_0005563853 /DNA_START=140 /DNA_END=718 /DNA_ORIENTATION=+
MAESKAQEQPPENDMISLVTSDGESFQISKQIASVSELVRNLIEDSTEALQESKDIVLPNMKARVLSKVIEFCTHQIEEPMSDIPRPIKFGKQVPDVVQEWYGNFITEIVDAKNWLLLFELILAANSLDIKPLLDLTCATVGLLIMNKTPDQIRELFGMQSEFAPEIEQLLREENKWSTEPSKPVQQTDGFV